MSLSNSAQEILLKEGYTSPESFIHNSTLLIALSKIDQSEAECDSYREKYGMEMEELGTILHKDKGIEDFQKEEDLEDWEFAIHALRWWQEKINELRVECLNRLWKISRFLDPQISGFVARNILVQEDFSGAKTRAMNLG